LGEDFISEIFLGEDFFFLNLAKKNPRQIGWLAYKTRSSLIILKGAKKEEIRIRCNHLAISIGRILIMMSRIYQNYW